VYLQRVGRELASASPRIDMQVRTGSTADGVLSCVELLSADLLVLATSLRDLEQIVARSRIPMVLVPRHIHAGTSLERVLVPLDSSVAGELALGMAAELAAQTEAELVVLRVAATSRAHVLGDDLCEAITEAARQLDADMIVMDAGAFLSRLSLSFVDAAAIPVLLTKFTQCS
jgi:nucleotide-binding universal stress UspA family protein